MDRDNVTLSKITPPLLSNIIPRKRIFHLLDKGRKHPILWICGPPGSGKTSLAASYIKSQKIPCLWYRLDEGDDDAGRFFYYLGLAARKAVPRHRLQLPLLSPETLLALSTFARRFFQNLYGRLKAPSAIVFDNYHEVPAGSLLHKIVHWGLAEVPAGINIFFTSRHDLPPSMADFRSKRMVEIIPWNVLSLTIDETEAIVKTHRKGLRFSEDAIDILHRRSGGWVGLLLFLMDCDAIAVIQKDTAPLPPENWPWPIKVYTLGQFKLVKDGKPIEFAGKAQRKPLELLKILIALGGARVKIDRICEALWPDAEAEPAYSSFTTTLMRLRRLIGSKAIQSRGRYITLDPCHCWVDIWAFEHLLGSIEKVNPTAPEFWHQIENLIALYQGPFLEGEEYLSDITFFQNRLRSKFLGKIHKIGLKLEKAGEYEKTITLYQKGIEAEPLAEDLYRYLMVCYSMTGRQTEVRKVYQRCRQTLSGALGEEPSMVTEKLYKKLQAKEPVKG